ncbi:54S ribosomal protein L12 precursor [Metarhizium acridum CQMa 102]|uniref:54S ribosomal protein L12 n=1 Tax=Metarhizium acridum (strain CQMa 102) TaxID=655827 RepID=E9DSP0_METAQ|nr:54S ribosomal protein L12 precursor [Metarhizium acridum CQMa 102]EFY93400.1 54S ribosomal protein L12 precursor [Metarhizium acridum CQMa 102]
MAMSCRYATQSCARQLRSVYSARAPAQMLQIASTTRRFNSTEAAPTNPKIAEIVDQISRLTLLETADLVSSLKSKLNIPDMPMGGFAAAAPAAAPAAEGVADAAPAAAEKSLFTLKLQAFDAGAKAKIIKEEVEEAAPAAAEKSLFTLKLQAFDAGAKAKIIKEVKSLLGLSLVDSKKFVESAPKMMKENIPKEEAEKIIATMKELGATVVME